MEIIKRELEIIRWCFFDIYKYEEFLYYLETGMLRQYAYELVKQN